MTTENQNRTEEIVIGEKIEVAPAAAPAVSEVHRKETEARDPLTALSVLGYVVESVKSLVTGLRITAHYGLHPSKIVTEQYPNNRATLKFPERFRGRVVMPHDESGEHKCTACTMCEKACPNGSISVLPTKNVTGKRVLGKFVYRLSSCTLCNLCIEVCPFGAIEMGHDYELATDNKDDLVFVLNKKEGR